LRRLPRVRTLCFGSLRSKQRDCFGAVRSAVVGGTNLVLVGCGPRPRRAPQVQWRFAHRSGPVCGGWVGWGGGGAPLSKLPTMAFVGAWLVGAPCHGRVNLTARSPRRQIEQGRTARCNPALYRLRRTYLPTPQAGRFHLSRATGAPRTSRVRPLSRPARLQRISRRARSCLLASATGSSGPL
jgi:hypothetical protein